MPVDVFAYGKPHSGHDLCPARATVVGPGRRLPLAKDSHWAIDRAPMEQALCADDGPAEGLLCSPSGCLLEGLVTNLFVVAGAMVLCSSIGYSSHVCMELAVPIAPIRA